MSTHVKFIDGEWRMSLEGLALCFELPVDFVADFSTLHDGQFVKLSDLKGDYILTKRQVEFAISELSRDESPINRCAFYSLLMSKVDAAFYRAQHPFQCRIAQIYKRVKRFLSGGKAP